MPRAFESLVNTEGFQTIPQLDENLTGLRVLLIQKDFKHCESEPSDSKRLRVLLIQKDFKHCQGKCRKSLRLRVLLIQKDFKQNYSTN